MNIPKKLFFAFAALALSAAACSRSNNLLFGRITAVVGSHKVIVTDCYRWEAPKPRKIEDTAEGKPSYRFTPCLDADIIIRGEELSVNGKSYGRLNPGDAVTVDHGKVLINDREIQDHVP
jgi:hypothetical protein